MNSMSAHTGNMPLPFIIMNVKLGHVLCVSTCACGPAAPRVYCLSVANRLDHVIFCAQCFPAEAWWATNFHVSQTTLICCSPLYNMAKRGGVEKTTGFAHTCGVYWSKCTYYTDENAWHSTNVATHLPPPKCKWHVRTRNDDSTNLDRILANYYTCLCSVFVTQTFRFFELW